MFLLPIKPSVAQYNGVYIGGPMWYGGEDTYNLLKSSGFNEIILWAIHVDPSNGDIYLNMPEPWNRVTLFQNGEWVSNTDNNNFLADLESLKQGSTSITRLTWSIGTSFDDDFQSIETIIDREGTGANSILYKNFSALKNTMPFVDAFDYDDERNYDEPSTTQFSIMLADLGFKIALCPYTRASFWRAVYDNTEAARPGTIDCVHLQCYAGGGGNNPGTWNNYFSGLEVSPGLQAPNRSAGAVANQMSQWENSYGIAGGFMWLWDAIEEGTSPNRPSDYAAAIQPVVNADDISYFNFNDDTINSYSNQDADGTYRIRNNGRTIVLRNNTWKRTDKTYNITSNTVLEFEFMSDNEGEIHGIGFDTNNATNSNLIFKLYGTQNWGITNYDNYNNDGSYTSYSIPVGSFYTGSAMNLILVNDNDRGSNNNSHFRNVRLYESSRSKFTPIPIFGNEKETKAIVLESYPNPTKNKLFIQGLAKQTPITIFDLDGKNVFNTRTSGEIDVNQLKNGVYLLVIDNMRKMTFIKE